MTDWRIERDATGMPCRLWWAPDTRPIEVKNPMAEANRIPVENVRVGDLVKVPREVGTITGLVRHGVVQVRRGDWVRVPLEYGSRQRGAWVGKVQDLEGAWRPREGSTRFDVARSVRDATRGDRKDEADGKVEDAGQG